MNCISFIAAEERIYSAELEAVTFGYNDDV